MARSDRIRLFCALRLPDETTAALARWQRRFLQRRFVQCSELSGGRLVPEGNLHVTLAFLGSRPLDDVPRVVAELRTAAAAARDVRLAVSGYRETGSVGMIVLDDLTGAATARADELGERLERIGVYRREERPWLPHVTVLRFRERPRLDPPEPDLGEVSPSDAAVYSSVLRSTGAQYEVLESVGLSS